MPFWRVRKPPTTEPKILGHTHGYAVTRVQFNRLGGFKLTAIGQKHPLSVPNDLANVQTQWVREWMIDGNFPEDDDPPPAAPRVLGMSVGVWRGVGALIVVVGTLSAGVGGLLAWLNVCW